MSKRKCDFQVPMEAGQGGGRIAVKHANARATQKDP